MSPTDATATGGLSAPTREVQAVKADNVDSRGRLLAADGTPLKASLARALRQEKLRAFMLVAPLLLFIVITFVAPIVDMLLRSVDNEIVPDTVPRTVSVLERDFDPASGETPGEAVFRALYFDMFLAAEAKEHTRLGSRLNYEQSGMASLFRSTGRRLDDMGDTYKDPLEDLSTAWDEAGYWLTLMAGPEGGAGATEVAAAARARVLTLADGDLEGDTDFVPGAEIAEILPTTAAAYSDFAMFASLVDGDDIAEEEPWEAVHAALAIDLENAETLQAIRGYDGPGAVLLKETAAKADTLPPAELKPAFIDADEDWGDPANWQVIARYSGAYTPGYFLAAVDMQKGAEGIEMKPDNEQIYLLLFWRTLVLSVTITFTCLLLGYPIAFLLANLPMRVSNLLLILVLLPFWTSLLVRTSSWIVLLQQQGVINDTLVAIGLIGDDGRLEMMFNETGTVIAMTHILLPFMILPLYSVMKTINPSYLRAAKSLGATDFTAFWRVYFPLSVPGIGAGAILVFILAIGYYITPELVGGTSGIFISNRIAYHISSSLNWGLAAALGVILLGAVLILYWCYDRIVGIDNVKLG
ncbi:MAG: ABC transporter permease [Pseudomonadota bacterium]